MGYKVKRAPTVKAKKKIEAKVKAAQFALVKLEAGLPEQQRLVTVLTAEIKQETEEQDVQQTRVDCLVRSVFPKVQNLSLLAIVSDTCKQSLSLIETIFKRRSKLKSQLHHANVALAKLERQIIIKKAIIQQLQAPTLKAKKKVESKVRAKQFSLVKLEAELARKKKEVVDLTKEIKGETEEQHERETRVDSLLRSVGIKSAANPDIGNMDDFQEGILVPV